MDDRERMDRRAPWVPWAFTSLALVLVAVAAYMFGQQHQIITTGDVGGPIGRVRVAFFPGWLFFWIFIWFVFGGIRRMWWYGHGWGPYYRPWRYGRFYHPYDDERQWEDWHRREHERMGARGSASSAPGSGDKESIT